MRRRGFTLIEVILALALLALLLGAVLSLQWALLERRGKLVAGAEQAAGLAMLFQRLEAGLLASTAGDGSGGGGGAGVKGGPRSIRVLSRAVWLAGPSERERGDASGAGGRGGEEGSGAGRSAARTLSDLVGMEVVLVGEAGAGRVELTRWMIDAGGETSRATTVLAEGVRDLRLRYFDGRAWKETFDSVEAGGLPAAVEVSVWMGGSGGRGDGGTGAAATRADEAAEQGMGPPTRVRVIAVPDGGVGEGGGS